MMKHRADFVTRVYAWLDSIEWAARPAVRTVFDAQDGEIRARISRSGVSSSRSFDYGLAHALPTSKIKYASGRPSYCTHTRSGLQTCSGATAISEFFRYGAYTMMCG